MMLFIAFADVGSTPTVSTIKFAGLFERQKEEGAEQVGKPAAWGRPGFDGDVVG